MGSDGDKMSLEAMWILFACVTMSVLSYAVLKPLLCDNLCRKKLPPPKPPDTKPVAVIKIHPQRAAFRLFPPGTTPFYLGMPKKPEVPKKKKKKQKPKLISAVNKIIASNAIRDFALLQKAKRCDGIDPNDTINDDPSLTNPNSDLNNGGENQPKNPNVFSASLPCANTKQFNGGVINKFARAVQLIQKQQKEEDSGKSVRFGNKIHCENTNVDIKSMVNSDGPEITKSQNTSLSPFIVESTPALIPLSNKKENKRTDSIIEIKDDDDDPRLKSNINPKPKPILKKSSKKFKATANSIINCNSISKAVKNSNSNNSKNSNSISKSHSNSNSTRNKDNEEESHKLQTVTVEVNNHHQQNHQIIHIS